MPSIGKRSNTSGLLILLCLGGLLLARPVLGLDVFTLWRQAEIPLSLEPGSRVDFRSQIMAGGRREEGLTRVVCLAAPAGAPAGSVVFEILPLQESADGRLDPVPGQGAWLLVSEAIVERQGRLLDCLLEIWQWEDGRPTRLTREELREDPLLAASLRSDFRADRVEVRDPTTRIISGRQFLCDQLVMTAADTQSVQLPAGRMVQITSHEITVAVNSELPILGFAFASERITASSTLDPPSDRMQPPPPRVRVEVMELVGFGEDGVSVLGPGR